MLDTLLDDEHVYPKSLRTPSTQTEFLNDLTDFELEAHVVRLAWEEAMIYLVNDLTT